MNDTASTAAQWRNLHPADIDHCLQLKSAPVLRDIARALIAHPA